MRSDPFPQSLLPGTRVAPLLLKFLRTLRKRKIVKRGSSFRKVQACHNCSGRIDGGVSGHCSKTPSYSKLFISPHVPTLSIPSFPGI